MRENRHGEDASREESRGLIARCGKPKPQIEAEEESTRKVYLPRFKMCREMYNYALENKTRNDGIICL